MTPAEPTSAFLASAVHGVPAAPFPQGLTEREERAVRVAFDVRYYLDTYPDIADAGIDPFEHYMVHGWAEGWRDPRADFSTRGYGADHPELAEEGVNPFTHWVLHDLGGSSSAYAVPAEPFPGGLSEEHARAVREAFDDAHYLVTYPDIAATGLDPFEHYMRYGWHERWRDPRGDFSTLGYLERHADVERAGVNPFTHWVLFGRAEGRSDGIDLARQRLATAESDAALRALFRTLEVDEPGYRRRVAPLHARRAWASDAAVPGAVDNSVAGGSSAEALAHALINLFAGIAPPEGSVAALDRLGRELVGRGLWDEEVTLREQLAEALPAPARARDLLFALARVANWPAVRERADCMLDEDPHDGFAAAARVAASLALNDVSSDELEALIVLGETAREPFARLVLPLLAVPFGPHHATLVGRVVPALDLWDWTLKEACRHLMTAALNTPDRKHVEGVARAVASHEVAGKPALCPLLLVLAAHALGPYPTLATRLVLAALAALGAPSSGDAASVRRGRPSPHTRWLLERMVIEGVTRARLGPWTPQHALALSRLSDLVAPMTRAGVHECLLATWEDTSFQALSGTERDALRDAVRATRSDGIVSRLRIELDMPRVGIDHGLAAVRTVLDAHERGDLSWEALHELRRPMRAHLEGRFDAAHQHVKKQLARGRRATLGWWRTFMDEFVALNLAIHRALVGPYPVARARRKPRVLIVSDGQLGQVTYYRAGQLASMLQLRGVEATHCFLSETPPDEIAPEVLSASAVVLQRIPATPGGAWFLGMCVALGVPVHYDLDDQIFDDAAFPPPLADYAGRIDRARHVHLSADPAIFRAMLRAVPSVIASTGLLAEQVRAVAPDARVHVRPNCADPRQAASAAWLKNEATTGVSERSGTHILYGSGTLAHKRYFETVVLPALVNVLEQHVDTRVTLIGDFANVAVPANVADRLVQLAKVPYDDYLALARDADVALAPLDLGPITDVKSEIKWIEATLLGSAVVVSPTAAYRDALEDGKHALFAATRTEWEEALDRLVDEPDLIRRLTARSMERVRKHFDLVSRARGDVEAIFGDEIAAAPDAPRPILIANTFFAPQSVGGATRVAESYVREIARRQPDRPIIVLASDCSPGDASPFELSAHGWHGALVIRCAAPLRDWADSHDERMRILARTIAERFDVGAAHLHAVQVLTASVADGLADAGVPVAVTLHDAWWLSPRQFLMDDARVPIVPRRDGREILAARIDRWPVARQWDRRRTLRRTAGRLAAMLAVSEAFATVYHDAGWTGVEVHENGIDAIADVLTPRAPAAATSLAPTLDGNRRHDRVVVGFVGGMAPHKGYDVLRAAARARPLRRVELLIVDHTMATGETREEDWNGTRVRFVGKVPMDRIVELYGAMDVLAAPSVWPEPFGLVSREARQHGVPVIVSPMGDIARDVEEGVDGWVVDVASPDALAELMARFDADPASAALTPRPVAARDVGEAVDELLARLDALADAARTAAAA